MNKNISLSFISRINNLLFGQTDVEEKQTSSDAKAKPTFDVFQIAKIDDKEKIVQFPVKFIYINDDLLFETTIGKSIEDELNNAGVKPEELGVIGEVLLEGLGDTKLITQRFNKDIEGLKRMKKEPNGIYIPDGISLTDDEKKILENAEKISDIPKELREKIALKTLTNEDVITPDVKGKKLDWVNFMKQDGKVYPFTVLTKNYFSGYGVPIGFFTVKDSGQDVDPDSIKKIFYVDPKTKLLTQGIYFEVNEPGGPKGKGGKNGVIVPSDQPLVIMNNTKGEAYFINADQSKKNLIMPQTSEPVIS